MQKNATVEYDALNVKFRMTINGNDDIINLVPKNLFKTSGLKNHFGKKYGFIVDTREQVEGKAFLSAVMLVKITTTDDVYDTASHFKLRIEPVFQADFAYIDRSATELFSLNKQEREIFTDKYSNNVILDYNCTGDNFVVPVPTKEGVFKESFKQHNKLSLSNPSKYDKSYFVVTDLKNNFEKDNINSRYDNLNLNIIYTPNKLYLGDNQEQLYDKHIISLTATNNVYYNINIFSEYMVRFMHRLYNLGGLNDSIKQCCKRI